MLSPSYWVEQKDYEEDFLNSKPTHYEYIQRLQQWRDKYENLLDSRPRLQPLAVLSHYLTEFQYSKVDEIEVPGQYTEVGSEISVPSTRPIDVPAGQRQQSKFCKNPKVRA